MSMCSASFGCLPAAALGRGAVGGGDVTDAFAAWSSLGGCCCGCPPAIGAPGTAPIPREVVGQAGVRTVPVT
eukprot:2350236-Prymnesium_polylepis.2